MGVDPFAQFNPWVIAITVAVVVVLYVVLRRWLFNPYVAVLDERQTRIDTGSERLAQAEAIEQQSVWDVGWVESDARTKGESIRHDALAQAEAYHKQTMDQAIRDMDDMLAKGRAEIAGARESETSRVRSEAISCVDLACSRLFGEVDPLIVESSIDRAIDRLV